MEKYLRGQSQELTGGQKQKPENNELQKRIWAIQGWLDVQEGFPGCGPSRTTF